MPKTSRMEVFKYRMKAYRQELIGMHMKITKANNDSLVGLQGTIIDETKHTLVVKTVAGERRIIKSGVTFVVDADGHEQEIDGSLIDVAPEERVKLK